MCPVGNNGEWYHTPSAFNAADRPTRTDTTPEDLGYNTEWQNGPPFLRLPVSEWPINRDFAARKTDHIPHSEILKKYRGVIQAVAVVQTVGIHQLLNPHSTNDWDKLLRQTSTILDAPKLIDKSKSTTLHQNNTCQSAVVPLGNE